MSSTMRRRRSSTGPVTVAGGVRVSGDDEPARPGGPGSIESQSANEHVVWEPRIQLCPRVCDFDERAIRVVVAEKVHWWSARREIRVDWRWHSERCPNCGSELKQVCG